MNRSLAKIGLRPLLSCKRFCPTFWIVSPLIAFMLLVSGVPNTSHADEKKDGVDLTGALGVLELRIEMAENSLKFFPTRRNSIELILALEDYLNTTCLRGIHRSLNYKGPPKHPSCIARMERLFQINPDNPVAICLRDGIRAPSCVSGYQNQRTEPFYGNSSDEEVPSLALKAGLPAVDVERLDKLALTLKDVDKKYRETEEEKEKAKLMDDATRLYDQILSVACRITTVSFKSRDDFDKKEEDPQIREVREKLLKIPLKLRAEHQDRMIAETEEKLAKIKNDPAEETRLKALLAAMRNPADETSPALQNEERIRLILPKCRDNIQQYLKAFPDAAVPVCHRDGWYTPQCMKALEAFRVAAEQKKTGKTESAAPIATPSVISKF